MQLDARKLKILQAIIEDYIFTATPVGSRTISKHEDIALSSATIRNEMSDLEELGYLEQPHTSAGRIPSDKAFRLYVDSMMKHAKLTDSEMKLIRKSCTDMLDGVESVAKQTAKVISDMTMYTSMVLSPQVRGIKLKHIQIVPLSETTALLIIVTDAGMTKNAMIRLPEGVTANMMDKLSKRLTAKFINRPFTDITTDKLDEVFSELGEQRRFLEAITKTVKRTVEGGANSVALSGTTRMLNHPEYSDMAKAKQFLSVIEGKDVLYNLLSDSTNMEFSVRIGSENENPEMRDCSIVTATYRIGDTPIGSLGVIGPTRMDYARVLAVLRYMGNSLSEILTSIYEEDGH